MPNIILSDTSASVSELKKNPMATVNAGDGYPVAILNRNQPAFYCVPAELYEQMLDALDDQELVKLVSERSGQRLLDVDLEALLLVIPSNSGKRLLKSGKSWTNLSSSSLPKS